MTKSHPVSPDELNSSVGNVTQVDGIDQVNINGSHQTRPSTLAKQDNNVVTVKLPTGKLHKVERTGLSVSSQDKVLRETLNCMGKKKKIFFEANSQMRYMHNVLALLAKITKKRIAHFGDMILVLFNCWIDHRYWKKIFHRYFPDTGTCHAPSLHSHLHEYGTEALDIDTLSTRLACTRCMNSKLRC